MKKLLLIALGVIVSIGVGLVIAVRMLLGPESVRAAVEGQASAALGMPVKIGTAEVRVWPRPGLTLDQVVVGAPAQMTLKRVQMSTGLRPLLSRRVEDAEIVIENSRVDLPAFLASVEALSQAQPSPAPPATGTPSSSSGITIVNVKTIGLREVDLVAGSRHAIVNLESSLQGDRLDIARLSAQADQSTLEATGAVESLSRRIVRLTINAERLDLDGFLQFASALSSAGPAATPTTGNPATRAPRAPARLDFQATVHAKQGMLAGLAFTNLESTVAIAPQHVKLAPLKFGALGGTVSGDIGLRLADASEPELAIAVAFDGVDLLQVSTFAGHPSAVTGTLNGRLRVTGRGLDATTALRTANGSGDVALLKGRMPGLRLVRPAVLAFGRPQAGAAVADGDGESFDKISATIAIGGGQVRTQNLLFASRDLDMDGVGALGIDGGTLDVKANLRLSEALSAQAGRDLVRYAHEGNRVVLPATITGTVASPRVMIDEAQVLGRALRNEVQERAKSLFQRFLPGSAPKKP
jgi:uncharacterized protein involved in outer membrane biogenesis